MASDEKKEKGARVSQYVSCEGLAELTGLALREVHEIVSFYDLRKNGEGHVHQGNFIRQALRWRSEVCKIGQVADLFEVTERQVNNLVKLGKLPKLDRGIYSLRDVVRAYVAMLRSESGGDSTVADARKRNLILEGDERKLKLDIKRKEYVRVDDMKREHGAAVMQTVGHLEQLEAQLPKELAGLSEDEIVVLLRERFRHTRELMAGVRISEPTARSSDRLKVKG